jgi:hypothetical protein
MWWHDQRSSPPGCPADSGEAERRAAPRLSAPAQRRLARATLALMLAALAGGCFQPLYGDQSPTGGPILRDQLSAVDVMQIQAPKGTDEARIAVEIRNALLYDFTGGGYAAPPTHRLKIAIGAKQNFGGKKGHNNEATEHEQAAQQRGGGNALCRQVSQRFLTVTEH